jgi:hypothetical protein
MAVTSSHKSKRGDQGLAVHVEWRLGPRTPNWEALWARVLADVLPQLAELSGAAPQNGWPGDEQAVRGDEERRTRDDDRADLGK